ASTCPLKRNSQHLLALFQSFRMPSSKVAEKAMDGCKPHIARSGRILPSIFEVLKKTYQTLRSKILQIQNSNVPFHFYGQETEKELKAVAVALERVRAHPPQPREMIGKEVAYSGSQFIGGSHCRLPRFPPTPVRCNVEQSDRSRQRDD